MGARPPRLAPRINTLPSLAVSFGGARHAEARGILLRLEVLRVEPLLRWRATTPGSQSESEPEPESESFSSLYLRLLCPLPLSVANEDGSEGSPRSRDESMGAASGVTALRLVCVTDNGASGIGERSLGQIVGPGRRNREIENRPRREVSIAAPVLGGEGSDGGRDTRSREGGSTR